MRTSGPGLGGFSASAAGRPCAAAWRPAPTAPARHCCAASSDATSRRTASRPCGRPSACWPASPVEPHHELLRKRFAAGHDLALGRGLPRETLFGVRGTFHRDVPVAQVRTLAPPAAVHGGDGPLTAHYKAVWAGETAAGAPAPGRADVRVPGRLAVVLDLSASMTSLGERAYHPAALGIGLVRRLEERVVEGAVHQAGGSAPLDGARLPRPEGVADLAAALLEAARGRPEVVLVVTDGYDNCRTGDAADVADGLRRLDPGLFVFQVVPRYTPA